MVNRFDFGSFIRCLTLLALGLCVGCSVAPTTPEYLDENIIYGRVVLIDEFGNYVSKYSTSTVTATVGLKTFFVSTPSYYTEEFWGMVNQPPGVYTIEASRSDGYSGQPSGAVGTVMVEYTGKGKLVTPDIRLCKDISPEMVSHAALQLLEFYRSPPAILISFYSEHVGDWEYTVHVTADSNTGCSDAIASMSSRLNNLTSEKLTLNASELYPKLRALYGDTLERQQLYLQLRPAFIKNGQAQCLPPLNVPLKF
ncbi:MAG: hypothetical protein SGJ05_10350 [bacterium]|nr:hypothetical protein [bacterium]